ncbi:RNA polymerase sigma factor [Chitinophaga filiformis]|uniref:RNA polymerase sigma-70 factor, ECF subfamily n=1 Tax=Chitinophaga filiformis TaxID=104663 RepID=A0A1G7NQ19_CHIFI|nr:RNA polymerase sigma-70 factor [Chitinophaga filiformis]SDF76017.1 RNA polymerase sigma-70 factor, ECF subfamily [Chitinophaga filiformis]
MGALGTLTDNELVTLLDNGEVAALEEIYLRYWGLLYQHARKMLHDDALAQDIVQDLFTALLTGMGRLNVHAPLDLYLYRAIRNRVIDNFDRSVNRQKYIDAVGKVYRCGRYDTDEMVLANEMKHRIEQAVADMPPKMREVFELSRESYMSRKEIADAINVSEGTVKTQMTRALKILRSKLTVLFV